MKYSYFLFFLFISSSIYGQADLVSGGGTTVSNGYEVSETYGQVFQQGKNDSGYVVLEGIQQPFQISGLSLDKNWVVENISVYPNPSNGIVHVNCPTGFEIKVFDSNGRLMTCLDSNSIETTIDLNNLAAGQYLVVFLRNGGYVEHEKIILQ